MRIERYGDECEWREMCSPAAYTDSERTNPPRSRTLICSPKNIGQLYEFLRRTTVATGHAKINGVIGRPFALAFAFGCAGSAVLFHPLDPRMNARAPETFQVRFQTSRGDFVVEARRSWAPIGADRFYNLVRHHFFDGQRF